MSNFKDKKLGNYLNGMLKFSKKIQKNRHTATPTPQPKKTLPFLPEFKDISSYIRENSHEFQKIMTRTTQTVQFDKSVLRKSVESLVLYSQKSLYQEGPGKQEMELVLKFDKMPARIPIKNFRMYIFIYSSHPTPSFIYLVPFPNMT